MMWITKIKSKADAREYSQEMLKKLPFNVHLDGLSLNIHRDARGRIIISTICEDTYAVDATYYTDRGVEDILTEFIFKHRKKFNEFVDYLNRY